MATYETADKKLVSRLEGKFEAMQNARMPFEKQWHLNLAFYFGRQWVVLQKHLNTSGYSLAEPPPDKKWRVRSTRNKIKRIIRNELTKLTKEEPQFYVVPATTEDEDRMAAIAAEAIAEFHIEARNYNQARFLATLWTVLCGTGFTKTWYDENAKDEDKIPGKVVYEAVTPFHLYVPYLHLVDLEAQPYLFHARTVDPEVIYNATKKTLEPKTDVASSISESRFMNSMGIKDSKSSRIKQCYLKEVWMKPCRDFPDGALIQYAEGELLEMYEKNLPDENQMVLPTFEAEGMPQLPDQAYPYNHGHFPFQKIDHIPTGRFYAESVIQDLIAPQREYNRTRSAMLEARNYVAKPQWSMIKGSFDPNSFTSEPGLILQVNAGFDAPKPLEQPALPQEVKEDIELTMREMDDISGQFEISKGRTPPGVEAASAIAFLQEENDTILYHTVRSLEDAVQEAGRQTLSLVNQYWDEERIVRVTSKNSTMEARKFKGQDIKPFMDLRVTKGSMTPRSSAAKQALITELMKNGQIPVEKAMRYLQMNETNLMYEEMMVDTRHAQRENMHMAEGKILYHVIGTEPGEPTLDNPEGTVKIYEEVPVLDELGASMMAPAMDPVTLTEFEKPVMRKVTINSFDNHSIHLIEHENYMKTQAYEMLEPNIKAIFLEHLKEHKEAMAAESQAMQPSVEEQPQQETGQPIA